MIKYLYIVAYFLFSPFYSISQLFETSSCGFSDKVISFSGISDKNFNIYKVNGKEEILEKLNNMDKILKINIEKPIESLLLEET